MNTKTKLFLSAIIAVLFTSCVSTSYYQVYKTVPSDKMINMDNYLVYEDDNCQVSYNFWGEGGDIGFRFFNKTDENIYLNLEESFFVLNGIAYDYYQNRIFTNSSSFGKTETKSKSMSGINYLDLIQSNVINASRSVGVITSTGQSISYNEDKVICIPSNTSKIVTEYKINESLYRDCDLFKYPTRKQVKARLFSKADSPIIFSNKITYSIGQSDIMIKFENEFYVAEISNYPESEILESKYDEFCGQKSMTSSKYIKGVSPDKFYIKYTKEQDNWKK